MKIKAISYKRVKSLEPYNNETMEMFADLEDGDDPIESALKLKETVLISEEDYTFWQIHLERIEILLGTKTSFFRRSHVLKPDAQPIGKVYFGHPVRKTANIYLITQTYHTSELSQQIKLQR